MLMCRLLEPVADSLLSRVAERRIAQIVRQTSRLHDGGDVVRGDVRWDMLLPLQQNARLVAQTAPHAGHFDTVGQAVVRVVVLGERVHLGFPPQTAEGGRKHHAVIIRLIRAAVWVNAAFVRHDAAVFVDGKARAGKQLPPIHFTHHVSNIYSEILNPYADLPHMKKCRLLLKAENGTKSSLHPHQRTIPRFDVFRKSRRTNNSGWVSASLSIFAFASSSGKSRK